jgi:acetyl/propionyl-CoA carboxylase alpha subunit
VIAEGPPAAVPAPLLARMEAHAVEFARLVGMHSAGTVEYAYLTSGEYFFLGFIPRLHEDFPITEAITGVSLVATQLHLAMGVSLSCVSDLRRLYDLKLDGTEPIDFRNTARGPLMGHCVAAKITAHDPGNLFHPSFGKIDQIQHSNHPGAHFIHPGRKQYAPEAPQRQFEIYRVVGTPTLPSAALCSGKPRTQAPHETNCFEARADMTRGEGLFRRCVHVFGRG